MSKGPTSEIGVRERKLLQADTLSHSEVDWHVQTVELSSRGDHTVLHSVPLCGHYFMREDFKQRRARPRNSMRPAPSGPTSPEQLWRPLTSRQSAQSPALAESEAAEEGGKDNKYLVKQ